MTPTSAAHALEREGGRRSQSWARTISAAVRGAADAYVAKTGQEGRARTSFWTADSQSHAVPGPSGLQPAASGVMGATGGSPRARIPKRYARFDPLVDIYPSMPDSERERIEALWRTHYRNVLAYAWRRVGDEAGAADVAAETFLIAWRRLVDARPSRAWLLAIARRVVASPTTS
jgi:Sigma-70 region 2